MSNLRDASPRHLEALVAVAEEGTFARAAARLDFTQSAVSQQIAALERAVGFPVFDRPKGPRPVELTRGGRVVLDFARDMLRRIDAMDIELDRIRRGLAGRLVVGAFQSVSSEILPTIVGRLRAEAPDVALDLVETDDLPLLRDRVLDGEFDLAFTVDLEPDPRLDAEVLGYDPFVVIAPVREASGPTATPEQLNEHPLIGQPYDDASQLMIDHRLNDVGVRPDYAFRFRDNAAVQSMVRNGLGWSVMPALAINRNDPGVVVLELDPPIPHRRIQLIGLADRTLPAAAARFRRIAREVAAPLLAAEAGEAGVVHADTTAGSSVRRLLRDR